MRFLDKFFGKSKQGLAVKTNKDGSREWVITNQFGDEKKMSSGLIPSGLPKMPPPRPTREATIPTAFAGTSKKELVLNYTCMHCNKINATVIDLNTTILHYTTDENPHLKMRNLYASVLCKHCESFQSVIVFNHHVQEN